MASYNDPYANQYGAGRYGHQQHDDTGVQDFNPYASPPQHPTYDQGAPFSGYGAHYTDEPQQVPRHQTDFNTSTVAGAGGIPSSTEKHDTGFDNRSGFDDDELAAPREKSSRAWRQYRADGRGSLWTAGSRGRCVGRFCCCALWVFLFLLFSIVLSLVLWVRPPNVVIGSVQVNSTGTSPVEKTTDGLKINLILPITVDNPNYFSVAFKTITADLTYPINNTDIGGGISHNVVFPSHSHRNFTFPLAIEYKKSSDTSGKILSDLLNKCGFGGSKSQITINYKIKLGLRIAVATVSPTVSNSMSFDCPIDATDLGSLSTLGS